MQMFELRHKLFLRGRILGKLGKTQLEFLMS